MDVRSDWIINVRYDQGIVKSRTVRAEFEERGAARIRIACGDLISAAYDCDEVFRVRLGRHSCCREDQQANQNQNQEKLSHANVSFQILPVNLVI
jgi:hypothetical protein